MSIIWILWILVALGTAANQLLPQVAPNGPLETQIAAKPSQGDKGVTPPADATLIRPKAKVKVIIEQDS